MHNLSHAVIYLANAPKSNGAKAALMAALADVRDRPAGDVPMHLRDASYRSAGVLGHGKGYVYPHDAPDGWAEQEYRPPRSRAGCTGGPAATGTTTTAALRVPEPRNQESYEYW